MKKIIPTILVVLIFNFCSSPNVAVNKKPTPTPETFLIPENFQGTLRVVYGEECGIKPNIENGRRILQIPENGVLIIQPEFVSGTIDHQYYLINGNGQKTKIEYSDTLINEPFLTQLRTGSIGGPIGYKKSSSESPLAIKFTDITVFRDSIDDNAAFNKDEELLYLTKSMVDECRNNEK